MSDPLATVKAALRARQKALRAGLSELFRAEASAAAARAFPLAEVTAGVVVAAFWPLRDEIDPRPLMARLAARGALLALPRVVERTLIFHRWCEGQPLVTAPFGQSEPLATAPVVRPALLLVPLLAFDRRGGRLGYGAGFYDRALAILRTTGPCRAIGLAFAAQEVSEVPMGPWDARLDGVVTELGMIDAAP